MLCEEAIRLGDLLADLVADDPEVHGLVSLISIQASRFGARVDPSGAIITGVPSLAQRSW